MNKLGIRHIYSLVALVGALIAITQGYGENRAIAGEERISWDSPRMRMIEAQWKSLWDAYSQTPEKIPGNHGKEKYGRLEEMVDKLFETRLSNKDLRQLAGSIGATPDRPFVNRLSEFMARSFVDSGDRVGLVDLLSMRCPGRVGAYSYIEFYLASEGRKLRDPIQILGEAYSKCRTPQTRHDLAAAVRRGFAGHGLRGKDDADFVNKAMQWYEKEKAGLAVNPNYWSNETLIPLEAYDKNPKLYEKFPPGVERELLFEKKPASQRAPGHDLKSGRTDFEPALGAGNRASGTEGAKLEGTWEVIEAKDSGVPMPQEKIRGFRFVFSKSALVFMGPNDHKEDEFRIRLGPPQRPQAVDLLQMPELALKREQTTALIYELQEVTTSAIYELQGDTLRFCLPLRGTTRRPTSFSAEKDSHETTFLLKRVKK